MEKKTVTTSQFTANPGGPGDDSSSEDDSYEGNNGGKDDTGRRSDTNKKGWSEKQSRDSIQDAHKDLYQRRLGIGGIMNSMIGKASFSGPYNEDLDNVQNVFDIFADMCKITAE